MTREDYLMAQALVLAIEVLSNQPGELRPDNNIREMKDCLDQLAVPSNLMAHRKHERRLIASLRIVLEPNPRRNQSRRLFSRLAGRPSCHGFGKW